MPLTKMLLGSTHNHKPSPLPTITHLNRSDFRWKIGTQFGDYSACGEFNVVRGSRGDCAYYR